MGQFPTRSTRDEQRARTRADLLAAAADVFAHNGYHGTSVDMVAEAAGYTKGAVYSNFASKEDLFLALFDEVIEETMASVRDVMDTTEPELRPALFGARRREITGWRPEWFMLKAEFELYAARKPDVRERVRARQQRTRAALAQTVRRHFDELGTTPAYDPLDLAHLIVAVSDGLSLAALNSLDADPADMMRIFLEIIARGAAATVRQPPAAP